MSLGFIPAIVLELVAIVDMFPETTGIPSTTYKGSELALIEPTPLIRIL